MMSRSSAAEQHGEWLPQELAAEIRGLLADSPAALSPRLSAWLACEANERGPQRDDRQRVQKRRLSEDDDAELQLWSSHAAVAPDGQTHEGTSKWGASEEWMSRVFALLDEPEHLKNARLVSQGWAKQIISMKDSITITWEMFNGQEEEKQKEDLQERLDGLSRTIGRNRLSGLEALELKDSQLSRRDSSISSSSLLTAACGGCPLLRTLKLNKRGIYNENVIALQPLIPRLHCFHLSGRFESCIDVSKIKGLLSSMSSMTDLHLDCSLDNNDGTFKRIPGKLLAVLPQGLARLSIEKVEFDSISSFWDLPCSKTLTDLTLDDCYFYTSMGLSALVNLKSLSILDNGPGEDDLKDILATLSKLEHLCIETWDLYFPESSATAFVQRLQDSLPLLTSLELKNLCEYNEGILVALGQLTGLTSLNLGQTLVRSAEDDIPLPPQALRHLTTLKALKHLSLDGLDLWDEEAEEFLDIALPFLQCLPSLESLYVKGLKVTELNAPLFPVQLKTLGINRHGLPRDQETQTAALVAVAARCPGLTSIMYSPYRNERLSFQSLAAVHQKAPNLQFDLQSRSQSPVDYDKEIFWTMASLTASLIQARPFLQLLERSVPWNTPKHPWNLHKSTEPWVAAAQESVIGLCRDIAAGEYVS